MGPGAELACFVFFARKKRNLLKKTSRSRSQDFHDWLRPVELYQCGVNNHNEIKLEDEGKKKVLLHLPHFFVARLLSYTSFSTLCNVVLRFHLHKKAGRRIFKEDKNAFEYFSKHKMESKKSSPQTGVSLMGVVIVSSLMKVVQ